MVEEEHIITKEQQYLNNVYKDVVNLTKTDNNINKNNQIVKKEINIVT